MRLRRNFLERHLFIPVWHLNETSDESHKGEAEAFLDLQSAFYNSQWENKRRRRRPSLRGIEKGAIVYLMIDLRRDLRPRSFVRRRYGVTLDLSPSL
jgi:hypothetical protein